MWPDRVSNPGPPTYESGALPTALRGPAGKDVVKITHLSIGKTQLCKTHNEVSLFRGLILSFLKLRENMTLSGR